MSTKKIIKTDKAPSPIGPYNQAVLQNGTLFISGQIAIDPISGGLKVGDVEVEAALVMSNLKAVLEAAEMDFSHVVKSSIFLSNMDDFPTVNAIYGQYFDEATAPARETVAVKTLPKNVNVEISMIAMK